MLQYLIKFSISLVVLYVFYRAVLRPLTFYQWNRFYLLGYSMLSLVIPFIDVSAWMDEVDGNKSSYISIIPSVSRYTLMVEKDQPSFIQQLTVTNWLLIVFFAGVLCMLGRLLVQYISLYRLRGKSRLLTGQDNVQLYETNEAITPFSFGNAIYINPTLHTEEELQRIIQHEFVHVRQKHSVDLLMGELLCIVNWFNPFAWLIRHAIRQNLEFIADSQVLQNGVAKKDYQYLLLKVIGVPQYAIASHFNFSNLKKRIAMMNKIKTAKLHLTKFLFVLPLLAVLLLAFRHNQNDHLSNDRFVASNRFSDGIDSIVKDSRKPIWIIGGIPYAINGTGSRAWFSKDEIKSIAKFMVLVDGELMTMDEANAKVSRFEVTDVGASPAKSAKMQFGINENLLILYRKTNHVNSAESRTDSLPPSLSNKNGYFISIADNNGECVVLVKDQQRRIVKAVTLEEWNRNKKENETRYGVIPPAPPPVTAAVQLPAGVTQISIQADKNSKTNKATVVLKNGRVEEYNLENATEKAEYIKKYGAIRQPVPPPVPVAPVNLAAPVAPGSPATPPEKAAITEISSAVPLNTDASLSLQKQPVPPLGGTVTVKGVNALHPPLYFVDGKEMEPGYELNKIRPEDIESVSVWKDEKAPGKFGPKATNGVIEIVTKHKTSLPDGILIVLDGKELAAGSKIEDHVKPDAIESMNVLKGNAATIKYGDKGKNGVIEIKTKKAVKPAVKK